PSCCCFNRSESDGTRRSFPKRRYVSDARSGASSSRNDSMRTSRDSRMSSWQPTASIATLELRAKMLRAARDYFAATRALEVETPTLSAAAVSDVHLSSIEARALGMPRYLHTSPEYFMKRLLAAGCGDIWQI